MLSVSQCFVFLHNDIMRAKKAHWRFICRKSGHITLYNVLAHYMSLVGDKESWYNENYLDLMVTCLKCALIILHELIFFVFPFIVMNHIKVVASCSQTKEVNIPK